MRREPVRVCMKGRKRERENVGVGTLGRAVGQDGKPGRIISTMFQGPQYTGDGRRRERKGDERAQGWERRVNEAVIPGPGAASKYKYKLDGGIPRMDVCDERNVHRRGDGATKC